MKKIDSATDGAKEGEHLDVEHSIQEKGSAVVTKKEKTVETTEEKEETSDAKTKEVEHAVESVKSSVDKKETTATTHAFSKAEEQTGHHFEAPNRVVPLSGGN